MSSCSGVDVVLYVVVWVINTVVMLCLVVCHFVTFIKIVAWSLLSCCIIWWLNTKLWKEKHCASRQHTYHLVCFKRFHKSDLFQRSVIKSRTYWVLKGYRVYFLEWGYRTPVDSNYQKQCSSEFVHLCHITAMSEAENDICSVQQQSKIDELRPCLWTTQ